MRSAEDVWIGVDAGTQSLRVLALSSNGELQGAGSSPLRSVRHGRRHEQDPRSWWDAFAPACRQALTAVDTRSIRGVAVAATSGTVLLMDQDGEPLTPALMYDDSRATSQADLATEAGRELWKRLGYQRMQPAWALPKLLWLLEHYADVVAGARLAHQSDFLTSKLAGRLVSTDLSNALKSGCDLFAGTWPPDVMARLGVPDQVLPPVVPSGERIGFVSASASEQTGLPAGVPILAGATDGCAAQFAAGVVDVGDWSSVVGTTLVLKGVSDEIVTDESGALYSHRSPDGSWLPGGASSSGAGAISRELPGRNLTALASGARLYEPSSVVTYPLASARGERFPFVAPEAEPLQVGTPRDDAERYASLVQGIGFVERLCFDHLDRLGAPLDGRRVATGGAATSTAWSQLRADIMERPISVPEHTEAAVGMAVLAASSELGLRQAATAMVKVACVFDPRPEVSPRFLEPYLRFVDLLYDRGWIDQGLFDHAGRRAGR